MDTDNTAKSGEEHWCVVDDILNMRWPTLAGITSVIESLAEAGVINRPCPEGGSTPLMMLCKGYAPVVVELALARGADPRPASRLGCTALHYAMQEQRDERVARLLVAAGADVRAADNRGKTPLHWAASDVWTNGVANVRFLLENGADPLARDHSGATPLDTVRTEDSVSDHIRERAIELGDPANAARQLLTAAMQKAEMERDEGVRPGKPADDESRRRKRGP